MELLRRYGLGTNLSGLIDNYWKRQKIIPKVLKCMETEFGTGKGVTQGDPASPMIFNIVVDAVVRKVLGIVCGT